MEVKVNVIEVASELADAKLREYENRPDMAGLFPKGIYIETEDEVTYTDEAQDVFNTLYDSYFDFILDLEIKE